MEMSLDCSNALAAKVHFDDRNMIVDLTDGRSLSVPIHWFPRLLNATPEERSDYRFIGRGYGIHWPQVDEDISVPGLLEGRGDMTVLGSKGSGRP